MAGSMKSSITIDTKQAREDIKLLNSEIKSLESGFKAATAGMSDWTTSIGGNQARASALTDIIGKENEKIKELNSLYEAATKKYGENSVQANNLQTQINNTTASMRSHQAELETVNGRLDELKSAEDGAGNEAKELSAALDATKASAEYADEGLADFLKTAASFALETAVKAVQGLAGALWDAATAGYALAASAGQQADQWNTMSSVTGISAQKLQEWSYASQFVDTDLGTITGSMRRLTQQMGDAAGGSDSAAEKFAALGISVTDANGAMRPTEDVFWDAINALGEMDNAAARDAASMDLFGRSAQELNPLIEAGREQFEKYGQEAHEVGAVLSDEQLAQANAFDDSANRMNSAMQGLQNMIGVVLAPMFTDLHDNVITPLLSDINRILGDGIQEGDGQAIAEALKQSWEGVKEWWNSTEVQELLSTITGIGGEIVTGVTNWLASDEARQDITNAINGFFAWLQEDIGDGKTRLMGIAETIASALGSILAGMLQTLGTLLAQLWNGLLEDLVGDSDNPVANWIRENMMLDEGFLTSKPGEAGLNAAEELAGLHEREDVYDVRYQNGEWTYKTYDPNAVPEWEQSDLSGRLAEIEAAGGDVAASLDPLQTFLAGIAEAGGDVTDSGKSMEYFSDMALMMSDAGLGAAEQLENLNAAFDYLIQTGGSLEGATGEWTKYTDQWVLSMKSAGESAGSAGADGLSSTAGQFAASGAACAAAWLAAANNKRPGRNAARGFGVTR